MTCKDCIHYEAHEHFAIDFKFNDLHVEYKCPEFKDRSKFIELPCKIGDTIYVIRWFDKKVEQDTVKDFEIWSIADGMKVRIEVSHNRDYIIGEFGKDIFFTREEAENKLKDVDDGR